MPDIEIKRGYEVMPDNNLKFGIRVINNSDSTISDVEVLLDYTESLFELSGNKVQKLGNMPPTVQRTANFILKPLACVHKENIGATIIYKDHQWKKHTLEMRPKEVHCVFPFLKEKSITRADFLRLSNSGYLEERGVNFEGINVDKLVSFLSHSCKNRLYKIDEFPIENGKILYLAGDALGEKAYYLLTAVVKEHEGLTQVLLRATSDKSYGLNGFLNETLDNLRHLVLSASAREIGIIKKEQVINIIDSVVQRSTISMEEGAPSVKIKDSMVQRTEFKGDEERNRREEERRRKEWEEQERLRRQKEEEAQAQREKEDEYRQRMEEVRLKRPREKQIEKETNGAIWEQSKQIINIKTTILKKTQKEVENKGFLGFGKGKKIVNEFVNTEIVNSVEIRQNSIGMTFALIPAGEFMMGSEELNEAKPIRRVEINKPFYLGVYPVTQREWNEVMGNNPSHFNGDDLPVESVSWNDAQYFIKKLNQKEGANKYRLPSEAEWEYSARAGTTTRYSFGNDESMLGDYAWYSANSGSETHYVGQKKPNSWGLYDMHGNVCQWVQDKWHGNYNGAPIDGSSWESGNGSIRGLRGGGWSYDASNCRSAARGLRDPGDRGIYWGFRLVREV